MATTKDDIVYLVCDSSIEVAPRSVLRIFKTKTAAYRFLGKYVTEIGRSTYTGFLTISEKRIGDFKSCVILGDEHE
jgi:hypothetical protein